MTSQYALVTFAGAGGKPAAGIVHDGTVYELGKLVGRKAGIEAGSIWGALQSWDKTRRAIAAGLKKAKPAQGRPLARTKLLAPLPNPNAVFAAGANYWDHLKEMGDLIERMTGKRPPAEKPKDPWFFVKTGVHSICGPGAPLRLPAFSKMVDWELELGVVIGKKARHLTLDNAYSCIAGFVNTHDVSARDFVKREGSPFIYDWVGQKCWDDALPMGPWIVPAAFVRDPMKLAVRLWVNGVLKQDSNTAQMVHNVAEQLVYLSSRLTLRPGDLVITGTPAGVGMPKGEFLKVGDIVRIEIEGLGVLENHCVAGM